MMLFAEYFEVVEDSLSSYSKDCPRAIREANVQLAILMAQEAGKKELTKEFKYAEIILTKKMYLYYCFVAVCVT